MIPCTQLLEAIKYLHCEAQLLHNDVKEDNILPAESSLQQDLSDNVASSSSSSSSGMYHLVLTDFSKQHISVTDSVIT